MCRSPAAFRCQRICEAIQPLIIRIRALDGFQLIMQAARLRKAFASVFDQRRSRTVQDFQAGTAFFHDVRRDGVVQPDVPDMLGCVKNSIALYGNQQSGLRNCQRRQPGRNQRISNRSP